MYLRPGNLYKDFIIEENCTSVSSAGRPRAANRRRKQKISWYLAAGYSSYKAWMSREGLEFAPFIMWKKGRI